MEDDDLDLQLLMSGPANEANMYEVLGGTDTVRLQSCSVLGLVYFPENFAKFFRFPVTSNL